MPNSCNSITKNICIALLVCSCASIPQYQPERSLIGKLFASNGGETIALNLSLHSNLDNDIIQIKKPFYGNVFRAQIDRKNNKIIEMQTSYSAKDFDGEIREAMMLEIIKIFYQCLNFSNQQQNWSNDLLKASCFASLDKVSINLTSNTWQVSGFLKL
jgi:hypothetical protein